jgi:hypothetical protein
MTRTAHLFLFAISAGCIPNFKADEAETDTAQGTDPTPTVDTGEAPPDPDACDDHPETTICDEGVAVICDETGDILSRTPCVPDREVCIEDLGCATCGVDVVTTHLPFGHPSAFIGVRPLVTSANIEVERLYTRPVQIDIVDTARTQGALELVLGDDGFQVWRDLPGSTPSSDGRISIPVDELPATVLIHAHAEGMAGLTVTDAHCPDISASAQFHSGTQPPLTGTPMTTAPWVQRWSVFNHGAPIHLALSNVRHEDRVGMPVAAYVVSHRDPSAWVADPTLLDLTEDGSDLFFVGTTDDNTIPLWSAEMSTPARRFGEHDVVLDFDLDGTLSPGDVAIGPGDASPGFTLMGDLHEAGPHTVLDLTYTGGDWLDQKVYFPADILELSDVPLVVISHGNGHHYLWYDYLGEHLASHGYVVMAHSNLTGPGIETASWTTLENTDFFFEALSELADGALEDAVNSERIVWIGHSRGGEGVVRAYDRMVDEGYETEHFDADSIQLISSIAPTVFYSVEYSDPHDRPYHLLAGAADGDVHGGPSNPVVEFFRLTSVAEAETQTTYLHGVGHNEFNCCGFADATGPDLVGRPAAQDAAKAYYLALIRTYLDGHVASRDYFSRRADVFRPANLDSDLVIANTFRPDKTIDALVIDDFQASYETEVASSLWDVSLTVDDVTEDLLEDGNGWLPWDSSDPMNGMTQACCTGDENRGMIFSFSADAQIAWSPPESEADWTPFRHLSVRSAQGTRHPNTLDLDDDLVFSIRLVDLAGESATLRTEDVGRITHPYRRTGLGSGYGWSNEFNTIRLSLAAFTEVNPALDLSRVDTVFLEFGPSHGSALGRVAIDDLLLEY